MTGLVTYPAELQQKVNEFKASKIDDQKTYWDRKGDVQLDKLKSHIKIHYLVEQDYTCVYCRQKIEVKHHGAWDTDHIIPKSSHPQFTFEPQNLCVACKDCNGAKHDKNVLANPKRVRLPINSEDYIFIHPHLDVYDQHIKVLELAGFYLPTSDKGRETVEICGLLRFVYKFADFGAVSLDSKAKLALLNDRLMRATSPAEEAFWLDCIAREAQLAKEQQAKNALELAGVA